MSTPTLTCSACNQSFDLTPEYLAQYAGQTTNCQCGHALEIPVSAAPNQPIQLSYPAPELATKKLPAGIWREGKALIIERGVRLPNRCAICGMPVMGTFRTTRLKFIPRSGAAALSKLIAEQLAQTVTIRYGYCREHSPWITPITARIFRIVSLLLIMPLIVITMIAAESHSKLRYPSLALTICALFSSIYLLFKTDPIELGALDNHHAWLVGFGEDYLKLFPTPAEDRIAEANQSAEKLDQMSDS